MFRASDGDTSPLLPLLLVTMAALLPLLPRRPLLPPPPPLVPAGGVGVVVEEAGCWSFFLLILRSLARRFWNQIFTWSTKTKVAFIHSREGATPLRVVASTLDWWQMLASGGRHQLVVVDVSLHRRCLQVKNVCKVWQMLLHSSRC